MAAVPSDTVVNRRATVDATSATAVKSLALRSGSPNHHSSTVTAQATAASAIAMTVSMGYQQTPDTATIDSMVRSSRLAG